MFYGKVGQKGIKLTELKDFLALNGSATYSIDFENVFIEDDMVVALGNDVRPFFASIRPSFLATQSAVGLGVIEASIETMKKAEKDEKNKFLPIQASNINDEFLKLKADLYDFMDKTNWQENFKAIVDIRLRVAYLTIKVSQNAMIHQGSSGYIAYSPYSRRMRESYFYANYTPTIAHLEKLLAI